MIDKEKAKLNMKVQWAKFIGVTVLYLLFLVWVKSWLGLVVVPFIFDVYITKKIKWQWWKDAEGPTRFIMSWVDALVFALVAVYFINQFFFQNYVIPSSSLEKSLLTGDYLFVSKVSYGPRIPETPLTMPLTQHTLPVINTKSYIEWPHWEYRRVKGLGNVQLNQPISDDLMKELGISMEDLGSLNSNGYMPLTKRAAKALAANKTLVKSIKLAPEMKNDILYPLDAVTGWTRDNYGPIWIPKKGATVKLDMNNIAIYERPIRAYEHNKLEVKGGKIYINGKQTDRYTFKMDYYWMMGDNRHNSADSRYWGFVPEDHIVGKPIFIWWSSDPDHRGFSGIRWSRLFRFVDNIK